MVEYEEIFDGPQNFKKPVILIMFLNNPLAFYLRGNFQKIIIPPLALALQYQLGTSMGLLCIAIYVRNVSNKYTYSSYI